MFRDVRGVFRCVMGVIRALIIANFFGVVNFRAIINWNAYMRSNSSDWLIPLLKLLPKLFRYLSKGDLATVSCFSSLIGRYSTRS